MAAIGTSVSFAFNLWFLPFRIAGVAALIGVGTVAMMLLDRRDDRRERRRREWRALPKPGKRHRVRNCVAIPGGRFDYVEFDHNFGNYPHWPSILLARCFDVPTSLADGHACV